MNLMINIMLLYMLCTYLCEASSQRDEIPDFEFEDHYGASHSPTSERGSSLIFDDFDDFFVEDGSEATEYDIATKEKIIQRTLFKAFAAKDLKYKFSEVLPLLRSLSKSQRLAFASIIYAQINGAKPLTLDEVRKTTFSINLTTCFIILR
ncbi:CLUMA_CG015716, isoform A [Clunio marinus]|uniref:CLUMA_CG015716, isoform A n=1 Tax=Clunio marinus TaxID=568069 RepID=A0A1J1IQJ1_9DIPT|nr:CLUMA_CG015716, isoform A [Clunio marinus]